MRKPRSRDAHARTWLQAIGRGSVVSGVQIYPVRCVTAFKARLLQLPDAGPLVSGAELECHVGAASAPCRIACVTAIIDRRSGRTLVTPSHGRVVREGAGKEREAGHTGHTAETVEIAGTAVQQHADASDAVDQRADPNALAEASTTDGNAAKVSGARGVAAWDTVLASVELLQPLCLEPAGRCLVLSRICLCRGEDAVAIGEVLDAQHTPAAA